MAVVFSSDLKTVLGDGDGLPISVKTGCGLTELQQRLVDAVSKATGRVTKRFLIPLNGPHLA